jgi:hypothetical protein
VYADVLVSLAADPLTPVDAVGSDAYVFAGGTTGLAEHLQRWSGLGVDGFRRGRPSTSWTCPRSSTSW